MRDHLAAAPDRPQDEEADEEEAAVRQVWRSGGGQGAGEGGHEAAREGGGEGGGEYTLRGESNKQHVRQSNLVTSARSGVGLCSIQCSSKRGESTHFESFLPIPLTPSPSPRRSLTRSALRGFKTSLNWGASPCETKVRAPATIHPILFEAILCRVPTRVKFLHETKLSWYSVQVVPGVLRRTNLSIREIACCPFFGVVGQR